MFVKEHKFCFVEIANHIKQRIESIKIQDIGCGKVKIDCVREWDCESFEIINFFINILRPFYVLEELLLPPSPYSCPFSNC